MKIHKLSYRLVRALAIFVGVLGAITLFTNTSFTGGQTLASAAECVLNYDSSTKTLTVGPGDLPTDFRTRGNVSSTETIVFVSADTSVDKVVAPQNSTSLFDNLTSLKQFQGMQNLDTSNVTNMYCMFRHCDALTQIDVSGFNTSNVTSMENMFTFCEALTSVDVSGFDTSHVMSMAYMFYDGKSLTSVDVSGFDTSTVSNMADMFYGCASLTQLDVSGFNTSNVTNMFGMFYGCASLTQLDLRGFGTSKVKSMASMFRDCASLPQLDLSRFDTSNIVSTTDMFTTTPALWKLTLGPDFVFTNHPTGLLDPVVGTPFNQNLKVNSTKWLHKTGGSDLNPTGNYECTADEIKTYHEFGNTDTYVWQGDLGNTTVEYVVEPTYTITIPATITIQSATESGTGNITLSAYPKVPYETRFIHISAASGWHLTTTGDETGAEYDFSAEGDVNLKAGSALVLEADGEAPAQTKTVSASLTNNTHKFKYAGTYQDTVMFTIETATS
ncbi:MAG: BspA family leucine-rich repeat surface protein [Lactobacillaceae bacterium]|jgi:surface protein|nr:BspA family leucine-rich repeat surface protein [Lactobacillaceae bacterium]